MLLIRIDDGKCGADWRRQARIQRVDVLWLSWRVKPAERTLGQKFLLDVAAWMDLRAAGKSDNLSDTISYTGIYRIAKGIVEGMPQNLLESVAEQIASCTLSLCKHPRISAFRVKVGKHHVDVHGALDYLGVEILRRRTAETAC